MVTIKARDERMLVLYEEGKSNEVIQVILATEFPKNIITARTVAEKLWKMGKKAHSEGSEAKEGDPSES
ncbi:hypothetical protein LCGC14_2265420, partial [marine sediment metagenome]